MKKTTVKPTTMRLLVAEDDSVLHDQTGLNDSCLPPGYSVIEHDIEFYAILQFKNLFSTRSSILSQWTRLDLPKTTPVYTLNQMGLRFVLSRSEFARPGIIDGKWRLKKHGAYVTVIPVFAEDLP